MDKQIDAIHDFWFGELDDNGLCLHNHNALWFSASTVTDDTCRSLFGACVEQALGGDLQSWAHSDRGLIALILLLDQFTRNIYRGTADAFAGDSRALALAQNCIATGHHQRLPAIHQMFLYLPLEHCEDLEIQEECVSLFTELAAVTGNPQIASSCRYAVAHREVIAQFGRFPHRNAILERESSPQELHYLETHRGF